MEAITLTINGQSVQARSGQSILDVVHEQGLDQIPTLCHRPDLEPYGSCFLCVVELEGRPNLLPACSTRVSAGMKVLTRSDRVVASRRTALELLLSNHYADCVSPCREACPAHVDIQGYVALVAMGLHRQAVDRMREANPFPAVCGRVCVRKCEVACRRADVDEAVAINNVKRFASDVSGIYDLPVLREADRGVSVAIVGAGPAGLAAGWFLGRRGYRVVVYEAMPKPGGMLRYGIPAYRLPDDVLDREIDHIRKAGVEIRTGVRVGSQLTLEQLREEHAAVYIAVGAWAGKPMRVEGETTTRGVVSGVDFLQEKAADPSPVEGTVVVVGGGNTAMDVARTAWRCGAEKVLLLYRRTRAEMPADPLEIQDCIDEGIEIMELVAPVGISAVDGALRAVRCVRMKLGEPDASGRRRPIPMEGSIFEVPCQLAVAAIGQDPVLEGLLSLHGAPLARKSWGTLEVDPHTGATNIPGVYAGGDATNDGPTVVIDAVADGQRAAAAMAAWLQGAAPPRAHFVVRKSDWAKPGRRELGVIAETPRHALQHLSVDARRGSFAEVATGFEPEDAQHECGRCLECGCVRYDDCELRHWAEFYEVDHRQIKGAVRKHRVDDRHPWIVYDPNKCVLCARCIRTCAQVLPIAALGLINRGVRTEMRPAMNDPLIQTNCVSCGNCVDACPTAALTVKHPFPGRASLPQTVMQTHCGFCSVGCAVEARSSGPGCFELATPNIPGARLCRYGRFGYELFFRSERIVRPEIRAGASRTWADLPLAWAHAARGLRAAVERYGPEAVAVFASPELTNEELFLAARIAREGLGTNNVGSLSLLATGQESHRLDGILGFTASTADRTVLADADLIICTNTALVSDHLVLAADVLAAVRKQKARLVVVNSTLDQADRALAALTLDPMRGRASLFWQGVLQALIEDASLDHEGAELEGLEAFLGDLEGGVAGAAMLSGVEQADIRAVANLILEARRVVFVHAPDRVQDQAPGDLELLGDLVVLVRGMGVGAELLLPRMHANSAGLENAGMHPAFLPGRQPVGGGVRGATSLADLHTRLKRGGLRAALVIGEDPLAHTTTAKGFESLELLVAMDWTPTETTRFANVVLPGSTWLESPGTRCSFEGHVLSFSQVTAPPARRAGWQVLLGLGQALGLKELPEDLASIHAELSSRTLTSLGEMAPYYWNQGQERPALGPTRLVRVEVRGRPGQIPPAITHGERYKRALREVGTERLRQRVR